MTAKSYRVGSRIVTTRDIEIVPWDAEDGVAAGDHGEVIDVDPETGDLAILMDRMIPALVGRKNYLFIDGRHLCQIRPESPDDHRSILHTATKAFGVALAASVAFMVVIAGSSIIKETRHPAYAIRFPVMTAAAQAGAESCGKFGTANLPAK